MASSESPGWPPAAVTQHYGGQPPHRHHLLLTSWAPSPGGKVLPVTPSPYFLELPEEMSLSFPRSAWSWNQRTRWALDISNRLL